MASVAAPPPRSRSLNDPEVKAKLHELRRTDNRTNWYYLARAYLLLASTLALAVAFDQWRLSWAGSWLWSVPVFALAVVLVGAGQHQLSALGHEAAHGTLFRWRWLNELASDLFCLFPLLGSTTRYRQEHLAHHRFVNDPEHDPEIGGTLPPTPPGLFRPAGGLTRCGRRLLRLAYFLAVGTALACYPLALPYVALLWLLPLTTTCAAFAALRRRAQHAHGDRGWLTNSRTFLVGPLLRFTVFPFGQDYHLPHHLYPQVPHYRLPELHAFLMQYPEYRDEAVAADTLFPSVTGR